RGLVAQSVFPGLDDAERQSHGDGFAAFVVLRLQFLMREPVAECSGRYRPDLDKARRSARLLLRFPAALSLLPPGLAGSSLSPALLAQPALYDAKLPNLQSLSATFIRGDFGRSASTIPWSQIRHLRLFMLSVPTCHSASGNNAYVWDIA
ncbi:hypothetical protein AX14_004025, partial [Amanita brunnescens Koide BX004]